MSPTAAPDTTAAPTTVPDRAATRSAAPASDDSDGDRLPAETVEVRTEGVGHLAQPSQLLWQGRLFLVRHALRLAGGLPLTSDPGATGERWRLLVGDGPAGRTLSVVVVRQAGGGWLLHRDAA